MVASEPRILIDGLVFGEDPRWYDGALWFSECAASQIGRITMHGRVTEYKIPTPNSEPRAMAAHPDGGIWFVETKGNALARIDAHGRISEFPVNTPNASLRGVTVAPDGDLWFTENFANFKAHLSEMKIHPDDAISTCMRLAGFGLSSEVARNPSSQSPGEHCFRPGQRQGPASQLAA